jgi:hypothetical protein
VAPSSILSDADGAKEGCGDFEEDKGDSLGEDQTSSDGDDVGTGNKTVLDVMGVHRMPTVYKKKSSTKFILLASEDFVIVKEERIPPAMNNAILVYCPLFHLLGMIRWDEILAIIIVCVLLEVRCDV